MLLIKTILLLLLIYFVDLQVFNFNQHAYIIRFTRVDNEFVNKSIFKYYNTVSKKISRDRFAMNITCENIIPITADDKPRVRALWFKSNGNTYPMKLVDMNQDFYEILRTEHYGTTPGWYKTDKPGCPLLPGKYNLTNYEYISHKYPPGISGGDYRLQYTLWLKNNVKAHAFSSYFSVIYKSKLKGGS